MPRPCAATAATSPTAAFRRCIRVEDLLPELTAHGLPLVAIHIPETGALSRKERDELKAFGQERGLRVFDDPKRLERDYPEPMAQGARALRRRRGRSADAGRLGRRAQGPSSRRDRLSGLRPVAPARRAEIQRPAQAARPQEFPIPLGGGLPHVRMGRGREPLERGAPSVHFGARRGSRKADDRPGALPRQIVRPGAERHRTGLGLDSYSPPRRADRRSSPRWASATKKRAAASASCWTRWNTARRRTAASRWAWTAW